MRTLLFVAVVVATSTLSAADSRAPSREQLRGQPPEQILAAMTTGPHLEVGLRLS